MTCYICALSEATLDMTNSVQPSQGSTPHEDPSPQDNNTKLYSLSPSVEADEGGHYSKMLKWALENRAKEDIKNIAITGPYGSGKSSILRTFENNNKGNYKFLNITLATFAEDDAGSPEEDGQIERDEKNNRLTKDSQGKFSEKQAALRLIELSILQQIFYHEKDEAIPDSRFKKTRSFSRESIRCLALQLFGFAVCLSYQLFPLKLQEVVGITFCPLIKGIVHYTTLAAVLYGIYRALLFSIRPLRSIQLKKFNVQDAEFGVDESISKSILNEHLDEILYFFEVTKYDVVVIEDLDRFRQPEIFTKLRELNHLINYSEKIDWDVTFIYAVKDEMFINKDRTKFFDFIIPIVPVINTSNSAAKLTKAVELGNYDIDPNVLEDLAYFIDDMRLMYNIMNEFGLYKSVLDHTSHMEYRLMSIIVYKNIFPSEFVKLSEGTGELYKIFADRSSYLTALQDELNSKILTLTKDIERIEALNGTKEEDLRRLYLYHIFSNNERISEITLAGKVIENADDLLTESNFAKIVEGLLNLTLLYSYGHYNSYSTKVVSIFFKDIEKLANQDLPYNTALMLIRSNKNSAEVTKLKQQLLEVKGRLARLSFTKMDVLVKEGHCKINLNDEKHNQFVNLALRQGYIAEDYLDYISIFYEGSITAADQKFLINVKAGLPSDFDYKLDRVANLIGRIPLEYFESENILNDSLFDHIVSNFDRYKSLIEILFPSLNEKNARTLDFIFKYIHKSADVDVFVQLLSTYWSNFWKHVSTSEMHDSEQKQKYYEHLVKSGSVEAINSTLEGRDSLVAAMESDPQILKHASDVQRAKTLIQDLGLVLKAIDEKDAPKESIDYVIEHRKYELNPHMTALVLKRYSKYDEKRFNSQNYGLIMSSGIEPLISYVENRFDEYFEKTWLMLDSADEDFESLWDFYNSPSLNIQQKTKAIRKSNYHFELIGLIEDQEVRDALFRENKVLAEWYNVLRYYYEKPEKGQLGAVLVDFLNRKHNVAALSQKSIRGSNEPTKEEDDSIDKEKAKEFFDVFIRQLLLTDKLQDNSYIALLSSVEEKFANLNISKLSEAKVKALIDRDIIELTPENYGHSANEKTFAHLYLVEKNADAFFANISNYELSTEDLPYLLRSKRITLRQKDELLDYIGEDALIEDKPTLLALGELLMQNSGLLLERNVLINVIKHSDQERGRITLLLSNWSKFDTADIQLILSGWGTPYSELMEKGRRLSLPTNIGAEHLAEQLKATGLISSYRLEEDSMKINTFKK